MSNAKHTAAPWRFLEEGDTESDHNIGKPFTICGGGDDDLIDVFDNTNSTVSVSREEAIANARLVAAAPDLLAALKALVKEMPNYAYCQDVPDDAICADGRTTGEWRTALAAIKNAEGKS